VIRIFLLMGFFAASLPGVEISADSFEAGLKKTAKQAKDGSNAALDKVDRGIHEAAPKARDGANSFLDSVERAVHRLFNPSSNKK